MDQPVTVPKARTDKRVFVHFMPWFETPASSGGWGQHWTMANRNPERFIDGKREIASHHYPLTGPYASSDPHLIEYQLLLMKYSGVDGVLLDWPGTTELWDYPRNARHCELIADRSASVGLEVAIVYEDRNIGFGLTHGVIADGVDQARADLAHLRDRYFCRDNYARIDGVPLLGCFGPIHFHGPEQWERILSAFEFEPALLTLWHHAEHVGARAAGEFAWVGPNPDELDAWYDNGKAIMGAAFPGFHPFYAEGGWGTPPDTGFGLPHDGTRMFRATLDRALASHVPLVQIVTWNDYGEGTSIEPTLEFGFGFLTALQTALGVAHGVAELELIYRLWLERAKAGSDGGRQAELERAAGALVACRVSDAARIIDG